MAINPQMGAAAISAGADLIGGLMGKSSAKKAAMAQYEYQKRILQNQHQWEVMDLRAAGLNPILSAGGSGPGGGSVGMDNGGQILANSVSSAAGKLIQSAMLEQQHSQADLNRAATKAQEAEVAVKSASAKNIALDSARKAAELPLIASKSSAYNSLWKRASSIADSVGTAFDRVGSSAKAFYSRPSKDKRNIPLIEVYPR